MASVPVRVQACITTWIGRLQKTRITGDVLVVRKRELEVQEMLC